VRFYLKFDTTGDAAAFTEWAVEAGLTVRDTWADGAPYPRQTILDVGIADDGAGEFAQTWADWIVSFGTG